MKINLTVLTLGKLTCLLSIATPCAAQDSVSLQFVSFPQRTEKEPVELIVGEGKTITIELPSNCLSKTYQTERLVNWTLGKTVTNKEGGNSFQVYGTTPSLSSNKQVILVIRKGNTDAEGFNLIPFTADEKGFSGGKYMIFNSSKIDVAGEIGDSKFKIEPLKHTLLAPKPSKEENGKKYLFTTLYFRKGEEAEPFYTSTWRFSEKARSMVFFYHEPHDQRLRIHTIRDYLP